VAAKNVPPGTSGLGTAVIATHQTLISKTNMQMTKLLAEKKRRHFFNFQEQPLNKVGRL
jgi:hypothetical protein